MAIIDFDSYFFLRKMIEYKSIRGVKIDTYLADIQVFYDVILRINFLGVSWNFKECCQSYHFIEYVCLLNTKLKSSIGRFDILY